METPRWVQIKQSLIPGHDTLITPSWLKRASRIPFFLSYLTKIRRRQWCILTQGTKSLRIPRSTLTGQDISKGTIVGEYLGEIMSCKAAKNSRSEYLFQVTDDSTGKPLHFINGEDPEKSSELQACFTSLTRRLDEVSAANHRAIARQSLCCHANPTDTATQRFNVQTSTSNSFNRRRSVCTMCLLTTAAHLRSCES
jgi:hypothetical protein